MSEGRMIGVTQFKFLRYLVPQYYPTHSQITQGSYYMIALISCYVYQQEFN